MASSRHAIAPSLAEIVGASGHAPEPFSRLRWYIVQQFNRVSQLPHPPGQEYFPAENLTAYWNSLEDELERVAKSTTPEEQPRLLKRYQTFTQQKALATATLEAHLSGTPLPKAKPSLDHPETQLLWMAVMTRLDALGQFAKPDDFFKHPVKQAVQQSDFVQGMLATFGYMYASDARLVLGPPRTGFYNATKDKLINLDLMTSIVLGGVRVPALKGLALANATAFYLHEDFHEEQSHIYPKFVQEIVDEITALEEKQKEQRGLSVADIKRKNALVMEHKLRHRLWNAIEDTCANQHPVNYAQSNDSAVNLEAYLPYALHSSHATYDTFGATRRTLNIPDPATPFLATQPPLSDARKKLENLGAMANAAEFMFTGYLPMNAEGAALWSVDVSMLEGTAKDGTPLQGEAAAEDILEIASRVREQMVFPRTKLYTDIKKRRLAVNEKRNEVIQELYDRYAKKLLEEIRPELEEEASRKVDQQIQDLKDGKAQPGGNGDGIPMLDGDVPGELPDPGNPAGSPGEAREQEQEESRGGMDVEDYANEGSKDANGQSQTAEDYGKDVSPSAQDPKDGKPVKAAKRSPKGSKGMRGAEALSALMSQDLETILESPAFTNTVDELTEIFTEADAAIVHPTPALGQHHDYLPDGTSLREALDAIQLESLLKKVADGNATAADWQLMRQYVPSPTPAEADLFLLVDGSGSMSGTPLTVATVACAACDAAGNNANRRVFTDVWGDAHPTAITWPGISDDEKRINLHRMRNGLGSGSVLAPAQYNIANHVLEHSPEVAKKRGLCQIIIFSDGGVSDAARIEQALDGLFDHVPNAVVDLFAVEATPQLENIFKKVNQKRGLIGTPREMLIHPLRGPEDFQAILTCASERARMGLNIEATDDTLYQEYMQNYLNTKSK